MNIESFLMIVRLLIEGGEPREKAVNNSAIPEEYRDEILQQLVQESTVRLDDPLVIAAASVASDKWLTEQDRGRWYYWPHMRAHFIGARGWTIDRLRSLDNATDRVLGNLRPPETDNRFDMRGLVLGHVQSGKTGNYTALIAKAADVGYRLIIVLAGMDKGLRLQTQRRLQADLTGYPKNPPAKAIRYPKSDKRWFWLTGDGLDKDFQPGHVDTAVLQKTHPAIMVVKKNGAVLRRLTKFLDGAPQDVRSLPMLMVDDEADSASIDTKGAGGAEGDRDHEEPTVINGLIRNVLKRFDKSSYVAYTATPFANILISRDATHPEVGDDLYPRNFIVDLPKPPGYFGAEELFGAADEEPETDDNLDVIRLIPPEESDALNVGNLSPGSLPSSLHKALLDFILAGAARACRGAGDAPATMLVHTSRKIEDQQNLKDVVKDALDDVRDEWRYDRNGGDLGEQLQKHWSDFERTARQSPSHGGVISFEELQGHIGTFMEKLTKDISIVNSASGDILDYSADPKLKTIAIGGNKLSRGLTLEGLLVSYYARNSGAYDALLQMGRWFGYRKGYADLTRIYTTAEIAGNFRHLAQVERQLRQDISRYEKEHVTPEQLGMRILAHPSLKVTGRGKMRHADTLRVSYSGQRFQTFKFPLDDLEKLAVQCEANLLLVKKFLTKLSSCETGEKLKFIWRKVPVTAIDGFLRDFDFSVMESDKHDILQHIAKCRENDELTEWTVAVMERQNPDERLGVADWGDEISPNQISRTRLIKAVNSLGVLTDPKDEMACLPPDLQVAAQKLMDDGSVSKVTEAVRQVLPSTSGLLMLYPISKHSAPRENQREARAPIYKYPDDEWLARDLIGIALTFPHSSSNKPVKYVHGEPGWGHA